MGGVKRKMVLSFEIPQIDSIGKRIVVSSLERGRRRQLLFPFFSFAAACFYNRYAFRFIGRRRLSA
ncbi:hypothetical protein BEQ56_05885 [Anaerolineaceae bacterium oral taxon 439]|nr:hypothetical protein BEQ56_05885 [Anaerolineaceae bacterium oral taxon 439]